MHNINKPMFREPTRDKLRSGFKPSGVEKNYYGNFTGQNFYPGDSKLDNDI